MKKKLILLIGALFLALVVSVGSYAATFDFATATFNITAAGGNMAAHGPAPIEDQPEWEDVLPEPEFDEEILTPDGIGDQTFIPSQYPTMGEHWDKVLTNDGYDTYLFTTTKLERKDLYNLTDYVDGAGVVNSVVVHFVVAGGSGGNVGYAKAAIKTNGTVYEGTPQVQTGPSFVDRAYEWTENPSTGEEWTWGEIDALQAGVVISKEPNGDTAACTQVYVVVNYELPPIIEGDVPAGDLFTVTPHSEYTGDLLVNIYVTNTGLLKLAYQHLNMKLYVEGSVEAEETPNYKVLSLENGVTSFRIEGGTAASYTVEVIGGGYALISGYTWEWGDGWTVEPEFYCEITGG